MESVTPPGRSDHLFTYTDLDALESYTPPEVESVSMPFGYSYTTDGELDIITRADGTTIDLDYDVDTGYLNTITWPTGEGTTIFGYEATTGQLTSMSANGQALAFGYDGTLPEDVTWFGAASGVVTRGYDAELRVSDLTVDVGGDQRTWSYLYEDVDGLLTTAGDLTMTHDAVNGLVDGHDPRLVTTGRPTRPSASSTP